MKRCRLQSCVLGVALASSLAGAAAASEARPLDESGATLIVVMPAGDACELFRWSPLSRERETLASWQSCPKDLYVSELRPVLIVIHSDTGQEIDLETGEVGEAFVLPGPARPDKPLRPSLARAGHLADGRLAVAFEVVEEDDDTTREVFVRAPDSPERWERISRRHCGRWEDCTFSDLNGRSWDLYGQRSLWSDAQLENPRVEGRTIEGTEPEHYRLELAGSSDASDRATLAFDIYMSDHGSGPLTFDVSRVHGGGLERLTRHQCAASLHREFLVLRRFARQPTEVYDVLSGRSLFGPVVFATWVP